MLNPTVSFRSELLLSGEDSLGGHALRFSGRHAAGGWRLELVALRDRATFDLPGMTSARKQTAT